MIQRNETGLKFFLARGLRIPSAAKNKPGIGISAIDMCDLDIDVGINQRAVRIWLGRRQQSVKP